MSQASKGSKAIALLTLVCLGSWLISGYIERPEQQLEAEPFFEQVETPTVRTQESKAQDHQRHITAFGVTQSTRVVDIVSQLDGTIARVTDLKGVKIEEGAWIASLDPEDRAQQLERAQANLAQKKLDYRVARTLVKKGLKAETQVAEALANLKAAEAEVAAAELAIDKTEIVAPFSGIIQQAHVQKGSGVRRFDTSIITLLDHTEPTVVSYIAEKFRKEVFLGAKALVRLRTGEEIPGEVTYTSYIADTETHTFDVEVTLETDATIYDGITADVEILGRIERVHFINASTLALNESGQLGVKTLDEQKQVAFYPVEILQTVKEGLYVTGLPEAVTIITVGQAFVRVGDTVNTAENGV